MRTEVNTEQQKKRMLEALEQSIGIVTTACKAAGVGRTQHYAWLKEDAEYRKAVENLEAVALDFAESKLHSLINDKNPAAVIFYLKTRGKSRGYIERQEVEVLEPRPLSWFKE